ncbi:MAG: oxidoreductase [Gammaproteobacteria bacterium]|nr:oxidoreductase [Gammaproteobacteria bacterium]
MTDETENENPITRPLRLPCGAELKNRLAKSAMSDSLGNGEGDSTPTQARLYERWAQGGAAVSIVGEVQFDPHRAEKPGNLVLGPGCDRAALHSLVTCGTANGTHLWPQIGNAGALAYPPISAPRGPSALELDGLQCAALTIDEIRALPSRFAETARLARDIGFTGVQVHAAHGFLLSQFLSPLFNQRSDEYGGPIEARGRLLFEVIDAVRAAVGPDFPVAIKLNSSDQLEGGLTEEEALAVVDLLDECPIDLIDISGGTYFPGAKAASDAAGGGPYFLAFTERARRHTTKPLMTTGGFKRNKQVIEAVAGATTDMVGLARALVIDPSLPQRWLYSPSADPDFPRFASSPPGGVTAWYTMRLTALGEDREDRYDPDVASILETYEERDRRRCTAWIARFGTAV